MKAAAARRHHRFAPVVLLVLALLAVGGVYAALAVPGQTQVADEFTESDIEAGQRLFAANCASCHGLAAEGRDLAPPLIGAGAASVYFQVSTGRMPMQADAPQAEVKPPQFNAEQTRQLAAWVASLGAGPAIPTAEMVDPELGDPANGHLLFRTNCAMCHGASGVGGALTQGKYAPSVLDSAPSIVYTAMLTGPQSMPLFNDMTLTPEEKRDIIAYIDAQTDATPGGLGLGSLGPVGEGVWVWIIGMGLLIASAVWIGAKSS